MRLRARVNNESEEYIRTCQAANGIYNPSWLEIKPFDVQNTGLFYLVLLDENRKPLTELVSETIGLAKLQAREDYLVSDSDWVEISDDDS